MLGLGACWLCSCRGFVTSVLRLRIEASAIASRLRRAPVKSNTLEPLCVGVQPGRDNEIRGRKGREITCSGGVAAIRRKRSI